MKHDCSQLFSRLLFTVLYVSLLRFNPTSLRFSAVDTPDPIPAFAKGVRSLEGLDTAGLGTVLFLALSFVHLVECQSIVWRTELACRV